MGVKNDVLSAKRAVLGLGAYEMDDYGELTSICPSRDGFLIIPDNCNKIPNGVLYLGNSDYAINGVKFSGDIRDCAEGVFKGNPRFLTIDLGHLGYSAVYAVGISLVNLQFWAKNLSVKYIFNEEKFAEQAVGLFASTGRRFGIGVDAGYTKILVGGTDISDKMSDPVIFKQVRELIEGKQLRLRLADTLSSLELVGGFSMNNDTTNVKAKRAILGLCDYEMDNNGILAKIHPGRNGDIVIPKGCREIMKDSIYLSNPDCTIKFSDNVKDCKANIFVIPVNSFRVGEHNLTIDLGNMGYKAVYGIGRSLQRLNNWVEILKVTYIFSEEKFAEQAVGLMVGVGNIIGVGLCIPNKKLTFGVTNVMDKMLNPVILKQMREIIERKKPKLNSRIEFLFELAEKEAKKHLGSNA